MRRFASLASPRLSSLLLATASLVTLAACNEVETGARGIVDFVPDDCGSSYCSFDDDLAVGATTDVYLSGTDDDYVGDLAIESSDPSVIEVVGRDSGSTPRFTIRGTGRGVADLIAIDRRGDAVDWISVQVRAIDRMSFAVTGPLVRGPDIVEQDGVATPRYTAAADSRVELVIDPGASVMGNIEYQTVVPVQLTGLLSTGTDLPRGRVVVYPPVGEHEIVVVEPGGHVATVLLSVR